MDKSAQDQAVEDLELLASKLKTEKTALFEKIALMEDGLKERDKTRKDFMVKKAKELLKELGKHDCEAVQG